MLRIRMRAVVVVVVMTLAPVSEFSRFLGCGPRGSSTLEGNTLEMKIRITKE
jgi:hypothetical protein